jgi:alpha-D-ribose 1-methylphosphonate 5-phosphate C-P lyase
MDENKNRLSEVRWTHHQRPFRTTFLFLPFTPEDGFCSHCVSLQLDAICMGKPLDQGLGDIQEAVDISNYFAGLAEIASGETSTNSATTLSVSMRQPYGVVASIIPWNFPSMIVGLSYRVSDLFRPYMLMGALIVVP